MTFRVADFLKWQRDGSLNLNPPFQRRSVWKAANRAFLVDTIVRGLPVPLLFLRERLNLDSQEITREVVDGQQRLRSLFIYIDALALADYEPAKDDFEVSSKVNEDIASRRFAELSQELQSRVLSYKFSVVMLDPSVEDRDILEIFARLNSTGTRLNHQELRNAEFFGEFKSLMYRLSYEQLERWRRWTVLSDDQIARMQEVQLVSDLTLSSLQGVTGRTQKGLTDLYAQYDSVFPAGDEFSRRFREVMDRIDDLIGDALPHTVYSSEVHFYTLFTFMYDWMWGLGSDCEVERAGTRVPKRVKSCLLEVGELFETQEVPPEVLDAVRRASTDTGRRATRLRFLHEHCGH